MEKHLKDRSYYGNQYDNWMLEECVRTENSMLEKKSKNKKEEDAFRIAGNLMILGIKHSYYSKREEKIQDFMKRDKGIDEFYINTHALLGKHCKYCNDILEYKHKNMNISYDSKKPHRMLFFYQCGGCDKKDAIYDNGQRYEPRGEQCKECNESIEPKSKVEGDIILVSFNCDHCGANYNENIDLGEGPKTKTNELNITELHRKKYSYSSKESSDVIQTFIQADELKDIIDESNIRNSKKVLYEEAKMLKKLSVGVLIKLFNSNLDTNEYSDFRGLSSRHVKRGMEIEFELYYLGEIGSMKNSKLFKILNEQLKNSNWEVRKNSLSEKLGVITGKMIGYDHEDDLVELIERKNKY